MIFRGKTKEGKWVKGFLIENSEHSFIAPKDWLNDNTRTAIYDLLNPPASIDICCWEIIRLSIAMSTGQFDKNDKEIFGSIELEDGTMSKGSDIAQTVAPDGTRLSKFTFHWRKKISAFIKVREDGEVFDMTEYSCKVLEVIGNQFEKEK